MKTTYILAILTILFFTHSVEAQTYTFKVIASSGLSHKNASTDANKLKVGSTLTTTDKIVVGKESYLGLSYPKGGSVQISKPGTYTVAEVEKGLLASKKTVSQKFANYVIGEVTKSGDVDIHKNPYKYQNVTGSVERGFSDIVVMLPKKTYTYQNEFKVQWYKVPKNKTYTVKITDFVGDVIKTFETQDTTVTFKWDAPEFAEHDILEFKIIPKEEKITFIGKYLIERLAGADLEGFKRHFAEFEKQEIGASKDAFSYLSRAIYFEEKEMHLDALAAYQEALKLEPKNEAIDIAYKQFLIRKNIGPAEQIKKSQK
jgi:hypothetical protein